MAYPAVVCLQRTVSRLHLMSPRISFQDISCNIIMSYTYSACKFLTYAIKENDEKRRNIMCASEKVMALDAELREAASDLEDCIESLLYAQILSQSESDPIPPVFSIDFPEIHDQFKCFMSTADRMVAAYLEADDEAVISPPIYFDCGDTSKLVGLSDLFDRIVKSVLDSHERKDFAINGMAGIGKTAMAKKILEHPEIKKRFTRRIFVPVGLEPKVNYESQFKRVLQAILAQVIRDGESPMDESGNLSNSVWKRLNNPKTLIVLDDVWSKQIFPQLRALLPKTQNSCTLLVTTRIKQLEFGVHHGINYDIRFMDKEESWDLLRGRVFGEEARVPDELEKPGKKIAENCEGLPLLLIAVADLLSNAERTPEFWNMVAADKENHIFVDAYEQISKVLLPSYCNLPVDIKPSFLYMRVFPQNHQYRRSRLVKLWSGEDFFLSTHLDVCLSSLEYNNVMLAQHKSESHGVKVYSLHSGFWYLCKKEAEDIKVLQTFNRYVDGSAESIVGQRRLAIYKNVLLAIKHIFDAVASVPNARSLLCTGAFHKYQVPICFGYLKLLRVLDALSIRFYVFPVEVLQLILLRYLALTCNGNLTPSISKLWNLQCLIVHKHLSINFTLAESHLPVEVWDLQELKYLEIMGRNLPDPPPGASLPTLSTLLDVDAHSCTKDVLQSIPELEKLRVQIELAPDATEYLTCFNHIYHLRKLKSFQCIVKNPMIAAPPPLPILGSVLEKLTLRGLGYPWIAMKNIAALPSLKVLKLQCYAFRGAKWKTKYGFLKLKNLVIEDTDLVQWTSTEEKFPSLLFLTFENCYKLQKIPRTLSALREIKLVDCNPAALTCAKQMEAEYSFEVSASYSWIEGNLKQ